MSNSSLNRLIPLKPAKIARTIVAGVLMGFANLVPGVSGGTMVLVMGLYDEFINSVADFCRFCFTRANVVFLALLVFATGSTIVLFAGWVQELVTSQRAAMYSLFIGLTLGGAPLLHRMMKPATVPVIVMILIGFGGVVALKATHDVDPSHSSEAQVAHAVSLKTDYVRDFSAGVLGISAMVLPGISGAYMLLVLGRYEPILAAISAAKKYAFSGGAEGDLGCMGIIIPVAIGAVVGIVGLSNLLRWSLRRHHKMTLGFLMGVLLGSVVGIWPFHGDSGTSDYLWGMMLAIIGFLTTFALSFLSSESPRSE